MSRRSTSTRTDSGFRRQDRPSGPSSFSSFSRTPGPSGSSGAFRPSGSSRTPGPSGRNPSRPASSSTSSLLFPSRSGFVPKEGIHYDREALQKDIKYTNALTAVTNLLENSEGNLTVLISPAGIGTWPLAFANNPKVSQIYAYEDDLKRQKILAQNLKIFNQNTKVTVLPQKNMIQDLQQATGNWIVVFVTDSNISEQSKMIGNAGQAAWYYTGNIPTVPKIQGISFLTQQIGYPYQDSWLIGNQTSQAVVDNSTEAMWFRGLQNFLANLIPQFVPEQQNQQAFVEQSAMTNVWLPVFTAASYDAQNNYEAFEFWGDKMTGVAFSRFLRRHFPQLTASEMTSLNQFYMTKDYQPELAKRLGLDQFIRVVSPGQSASTITDYQYRKILEDVYEAFFGGVTEIAENNFGFGTAADYANNLMELSLEGTTIDMEKARGAAKTILLQLFSRMGWPQPVFSQRTQGDQIQVTVTLPTGSLNKLHAAGFKNVDPILAEVSGRGKSEVETQAARLALEKIESIGFTQEAAEKLRAGQIFSSPEMIQYKKELDEAFEFFGYTDPEFTVTTQPEGVIVFMYANDGGVKRQISQGEGQSVAEARLQALQNFLSSVF